MILHSTWLTQLTFKEKYEDVLHKNNTYITITINICCWKKKKKQENWSLFPKENTPKMEMYFPQHLLQPQSQSLLPLLCSWLRKSFPTWNRSSYIVASITQPSTVVLAILKGVWRVSHHHITLHTHSSNPLASCWHNAQSWLTPQTYHKYRNGSCLDTVIYSTRTWQECTNVDHSVKQAHN